MEDRGFTGYASDFATTVKENGEDIIVVTQEIEKLFTDTLDFLADETNLDKMVSQIQVGLETLLEKLEAGDLFTVEKLEKLFDGLIDQTKDSLGIDLESALDPEKMLQSVSSLIPEDVFPEELKKIFQQIKDFFSSIDLSNVRLKVKNVAEPVPKPTATTSSGLGTGGIQAGSMPSSFDVFSPAAGSASPSPAATDAAEVDSLLEDLFKKMSESFLTKQDLIDGFLKKMDEAVVESGFYRQLEEKREAFIKSITSGKIEIKKIFRAVAQLIVDLMAGAIQAISMILEAVIDDLKALIQMIKGLLTIKPGSLVGALLEQFGVQNFNPSLLSLPAFLISVPYTLLIKAATGKKPAFPSVFQDDTTDTNNKWYGSAQIIKSILPFFGLAADKLSTNHHRWALATGTAGDILAPILDVVGQMSSVPFKPKSETKTKDVVANIIWGFQWLNNVLLGIIAVIQNLVYELATEEWKDRNRGKRKILPTVQVISELLHLGMFITFYIMEQEADKEGIEINDPRTRIGYMLDAFPGIIGGIISLQLVPIDDKLEAGKKTADQRRADAKRKIYGRIQYLKGRIGNTLPLSDTAELTNFIGLPPSPSATFGDLDGYLPLITTGILQPAEEIRKTVTALMQANPSATVKSRVEAVSKALEFIRGTDYWKDLVHHHQQAKPAIIEFRKDAVKLINEILAGLKSLEHALNINNINTIRVKIGKLKTLSGDVILQKWTTEAPGKTSGLHRDVRRNKLLGSIFHDNAGRLSLISASRSLQKEVDQLIAVLGNDGSMPKLRQQNDLLKRKTTDLANKKPRVQSLLRLFPPANRSVQGKTALFPPLAAPLGSIEEIWTEVERIFGFFEDMETNITPAEVRDLEKKKNRFLGINIFTTLVFQLVYGSLYVNTGINP